MKAYITVILFTIAGNVVFCQSYLSNSFSSIRAQSRTDSKGAILGMDQVIKSNPSDSAYFFRGLLKSWDKDLDGAIADLKQSIILNVHNADAFLLLAQLYQRRGSFYLFSLPNLSIADYDSSEIAATKAIGLRTNTNDYYCRAETRFELKNFTGALKDYDMAIRVGTDSLSFYVHYYRGKCRFILQDYVGTLEDGIKCEKLSSKTYHGYELKAIAKLALCLKNEACADFSECLLKGGNTEYVDIFKDLCK